MKTEEQILAELAKRIEYIKGEMLQADYVSDTSELAIGWDKGYLNALCDIQRWMTSHTQD